MLYFDRFIVALVPHLSINRIDLQYLDIKNKKKSITRVVMIWLIASMFVFPYWGFFVSGVSFLYVCHWLAKEYIGISKKAK